VLGHWGADVIKVESPRAWDPVRGPGGGQSRGSALGYKHYNRDKRAVAIDLTRPEGRDVLYRLIADADVLLTSLLAATRRKLRVDVDDVRAVNPRIVYARVTGHGPLGPDSGQPGFDLAAWWARGSLAAETMQVGGLDWPSFMVGHGDGMSGLVLAGGICAALVQRERTGKAPVVDVSLLGTAIWFNALSIIKSRHPDLAYRNHRPRREEQLPGMQLYRTADGRFIQLVMLGNRDEDWADLCHHLGRPDLTDDPRFCSPAARAAHTKEGVEVLDAMFAGSTLAEWRRRLAGSHVVWSVVQTPGEIYDDPQTAANGYIRAVADGPDTLALPVPPIHFDLDTGDSSPAPDFAQHTDEVLRDAGLTADEIWHLRATGVVA
jgi:crotonobetainyl-CoA:carnitine CoA-transferase CaiB-like acyl-CoA transferase